VFRSDVKSYYASIDHYVLMEQLHSYINDTRVITLIWDYLNRTVKFGGLYRNIKWGISLGCPLCPLVGELYLKLMDDRMGKNRIVLSPNRCKLKKSHGRMGTKKGWKSGGIKMEERNRSNITRKDF
jgi:RNA-directed DNA polymerase